MRVRWWPKRLIPVRVLLPLVVVALVASPSAVSASGARLGPLALPGAPTGAISGLVTDDLGIPMSGVVIEASGGLPFSTVSTATAPDGTYSFPSLATGSWSVSFAAPVGSGLVNEYWSNAHVESAASSIWLTDGANISIIDAQFELGGSLSGTVLDNFGVPLPGVSVTATSPWSTSSEVTAADGSYQLTVLAGSYTVSFDAPTGSLFYSEFWDNVHDEVSATAVPVAQGVDTPNVDAQLEEAGAISGIVIDHTGAGLSGTTVYAFSPGAWSSVTTEADGSYAISGLATGSYTMRFVGPIGAGLVSEFWDDTYQETAATPVAVVVGAETSGINAELLAEGSISGLVTDEFANPVAGVTVFASSAVGGWSFFGITAVDGTYQLPFMWPGDYTVSFTPPAGSGLQGEYWDDVTDDAFVSAVAVTPGADLPNVDAGLASGPALCNGLVVTVDLGLGQAPTAGNDVILGTVWDDYINALAGDDVVCAGPGDDTVFGGTGNDAIFGDDGNDDLRGQLGDDLLDGGLGIDTIRGRDGVDTILGGPGDDLLYGGLSGDVISGGNGNDLVQGGGGSDTIDGGPGDDFLVGGTGNDSVDGGSGDDVIYLTSGDDSAVGGDGIDEVRGGAGIDTISGGLGNDLLYGSVQADTINGDGGDDVIWGEAGNDTLNGGVGDDLIRGGDGADTIDGGDGNDALNGDRGNDTVFGGAGNDHVRGQHNNDTLYGGDGVDLVIGGMGLDWMSGGPGSPDTCNGGVQADVADASCEMVRNVP